MLESSRICAWCGKQFRPEVGRQIYCSPDCRHSSANSRRRKKRFIKSAEHTDRHNRSLLAKKLHYSITEAAIFLGVSRPTIYAKIKAGELHAIRIGPRTIRIPADELQISSKRKPDTPVTIEDPITKDEAIKEFGISETWFYRTIKKKDVISRKAGPTIYYSKSELSPLFKREIYDDITEWYSAEELAEQFGLSRKYINDFARTHKIPRKREGQKLFISKKNWDNARFFKGKLETEYMTVDQAKAHYRIDQQRFYDTVKAENIPRHRDGASVYFAKKDLDRLFSDLSPKIPKEIKRDFIRSGDVLKKYRIGQKRFCEETKVANVTKININGNSVWYKKNELDALFKNVIEV